MALSQQQELTDQLDGLEGQAQQLRSMIGGDPQSPLIPLQRELAVAIEGIHHRLSVLRGGQGEGQGAATAATAADTPADEVDGSSCSLPRRVGGHEGGGGEGGGEEERVGEAGRDKEEANGRSDHTGGDGRPNDDDSTSYPSDHPPAASIFGAGDPCLAPRVFDRRRARAVVEEVLPAPGGTCLVTWLHPRQKGELVCRYWKEGRRCKFSGPDCPFSHGVEVSLSELRPDDNNREWEAPSSTTTPATAGATADGGSAPAWLLKDKPLDAEETPKTTDGGSGGNAARGTGGDWLASLRSGSRILARYFDGVWYEATAEGSAAAGKPLAVRFRGFEDEGPVSIPADGSHVAPLEENGGRRRKRGTGDPSDEDEVEVDAWADATRDGSGRDDFTAETFFQERVLGDRPWAAVRQGPVDKGCDNRTEGGLCSDAYVFGDWEQHTKGFGSRMMNRMGYRRGEGLGKEKQGISRPVPIHVLPERRALDHLRVEDSGGGGGGLRTGSSSGGSSRKRKNKATSEGSSDQQHSGGDGGMFNFLNKTMNASINKAHAVASASVRAGAGRSAGRFFLAGQKTGLPSTSSTLRGDYASSASPAGAGVANSPMKPAVFSDRAREKGRVAGEKAAAAASGMTQSELRSHLVGAREAEAVLAGKIGRLQETITRNSERDPRTAAQARQKLEEVRLQAKEVRASRDRAERELGNRGLSGGGGGGGSKGGKKGRGKGGLFSF